ncbi:MAG: hypothetical protein HY283_10055 [Nitrospirae bacterium]|nr:hypothetical protein [Nitrospirota bacterium]
MAGAAALTITPMDEQGRPWQEPYTDDNGNGRYDAPDPLNPAATADRFEDTNHNGKWDGPFLAGYKHKGSYYVATGAHDPLWTRVLILQFGEMKLAFVALDAVGYSYPEVQAIRKEAADLGFRQIIVASTHTHEGPDTIGLWGPNPFTDGKDPRLMEYIRNRTLAALREADKHLQPARLTLAQTTLPELFGRIIADRRDPIVLDNQLTILKLDDSKGRTIATLVNGSIHPETLGGQGSLISSDFPHYLREGIEKGGFSIQGRTIQGFGGIALYFNGAVGGLMTTLGVEVKDESGKILPQRSWEKMQRIGELMAGTALEALQGKQPAKINGLTVKTKTITLPLDNRYLRTMIEKGVIQRDSYTNGLPVKMPIVGQDIQSEVDLITIRGWTTDSKEGPLAQIITLPGELFPEIALGGYLEDTDTCWSVTERKKAMDGIGRERISAANPGTAKEPVLLNFIKAPYSFLFGLANDELGYIVPANDFVFPTYTPGPVFGVDRCGSKDHYEETLSASSKMAPIVTQTLIELIKSDP